MDYLDNINLEEKILDITSFKPISVYRNSHNYNISNQLLHLNFIHLIYYLNNTVDLNYNENQINHILKIYKDYELSVCTFEKIFLTMCKYLKIINITLNNRKVNIEINSKFLNINDTNDNSNMVDTDNINLFLDNKDLSPDNTDSSSDNAAPVSTDNPSEYNPSIQFISNNTTILDVLNIISKAVDNKLCIIREKNRSYMHLLTFFDQLEQIPTIKFISSGIQEISYRDKFKKNPTYKLLTYIKEKDSANEQLAQHIKTSDIQLKKELRNFYRPSKIVLTTLFSKDEYTFLYNVKNNEKNSIIPMTAYHCFDNCNGCVNISPTGYQSDGLCVEAAGNPTSWIVNHVDYASDEVCVACSCPYGENDWNRCGWPS